MTTTKGLPAPFSPRGALGAGTKIGGPAEGLPAGGVLPVGVVPPVLGAGGALAVGPVTGDGVGAGPVAVGTLATGALGVVLVEVPGAGALPGTEPLVEAAVVEPPGTAGVAVDPGGVATGTIRGAAITVDGAPAGRPIGSTLKGAV